MTNRICDDVTYRTVADLCRVLHPWCELDFDEVPELCAEMREALQKHLDRDRAETRPLMRESGMREMRNAIRDVVCLHLNELEDRYLQLRDELEYIGACHVANKKSACETLVERINEAAEAAIGRGMSADWDDTEAQTREELLQNLCACAYQIVAALRFEEDMVPLLDLLSDAAAGRALDSAKIEALLPFVVDAPK